MAAQTKIPSELLLSSKNAQRSPTMTDASTTLNPFIPQTLKSASTTLSPALFPIAADPTICQYGAEIFLIRLSNSSFTRRSGSGPRKPVIYGPLEVEFGEVKGEAEKNRLVVRIASVMARMSKGSV
jgi:hypothetical protein